jgi:toxin ParE1/3/4
VNRRFVVLPTADRDLEQQADYLELEASLEAALRFFGAAETTFALLAEHPEMGPLRQSTKAELAGIRSWRVKGFEKILIFYRVTCEGIEVLRVLHSHRDIDATLDDE